MTSPVKPKSKRSTCFRFTTAAGPGWFLGAPCHVGLGVWFGGSFGVGGLVCGFGVGGFGVGGFLGLAVWFVGLVYEFFWVCGLVCGFLEVFDGL